MLYRLVTTNCPDISKACLGTLKKYANYELVSILKTIIYTYLAAYGLKMYP